MLYLLSVLVWIIGTAFIIIGLMILFKPTPLSENSILYKYFLSDWKLWRFGQATADHLPQAQIRLYAIRCIISGLALWFVAYLTWQ